MSKYAEILESSENLRVKLVLDTSPHPPYNDGGSPIISLRPWRGGWQAEHVDRISTFVPLYIDDIIRAAEHFGSHHELFERYMRIYQGATAIEWFDDYLTFDTPDWREYVGCADGVKVELDMAEWKAYIEGDVWGNVIEKRISWTRSDDPTRAMETWEEVDSCWGYYGREYAELAAREVYEDYLESGPDDLEKGDS